MSSVFRFGTHRSEVFEVGLVADEGKNGFFIVGGGGGALAAEALQEEARRLEAASVIYGVNQDANLCPLHQLHGKLTVSLQSWKENTRGQVFAQSCDVI